MASCEMPLAAASFLKAASQGSNAPVLRQLAWPNAAVGIAASATASSAQPVCFVRMLRIPLLRLFLLVQPQLAYPDRAGRLTANCDPANRATGAWTRDDQFSTTS